MSDSAQAPRDPAHKNWLRWGEADERGALNLIDDEKRLRAMKAAKTGKVYNLAIPLGRYSIPQLPYRGPAQRLTITSTTDQDWWEGMAESLGVPAPGTGANEDMLISANHNGTHMDALAHVYAEGKHYNGFPSSGTSSQAGASHVGIDKAGGFAGRGVLLDIAGHLGVPVLTPGFVITADLLEEVRAAQGVSMEPGDILLLRTGWIDSFNEANAKGEAVPVEQPGIGLSALEFIDRHDVAVIGGDNQAVESFPAEGSFLSGHVELLVNRGIHLIENMSLTELAEDKCYEFFLSVGVLPITGGTASPVNPIAIG